MYVKLEAPDEDSAVTAAPNKTENKVESSTTKKEESSSNMLVNGLRPEFKDAMDSYEKFFDEYCTFMKKYNSSEDQSSMLTDYMKFLNQYNETMEKMDALEDDKLNDAELAYYTKVINRINQKLLEISA